jgi:hypothetical protein
MIMKRYKDGSMFKMDHDLYNKINNGRRRKEYTLENLKHPIYKHMRDEYFKSPWHKIHKFKYDGKQCTNTGISFVYDTGFVLRLNYTYYANDKKVCRYRYIQNINSVKFLRLLKVKDITIIN